MRAWLDDQGDQPDRTAPRVRRGRGTWLEDEPDGPTLGEVTDGPSSDPLALGPRDDEVLARFTRDPRDVLHAPQLDETPSNDAATTSAPDVETESADRGWATGLCVAGGFAIAAMFASGIATGDNELVAAAAIAIALATLTALGLKFLTRRSPLDSQSIGIILGASMSLKLLGTLARFYVGTSVYDRSDASEYDIYGRNWANDYLANGSLPNVNQWTSTNFVRLVIAEFYHYTTPTKIGGFVFFSWLGWLGLVAFWRAFRRVMPTRERRYMLLVLFAPSLMYWPSSIGKEALIILGLGLATYGLSLLLTDALVIGLPITAAGLMLTTYVRSHVAIVLTLALGAAMVFRKRAGPKVSGTVLTLVMFAAVGSFVLSTANSYFKSNLFDGTGAVQAELDSAEDRTAQGGSQFTPAPAWNFPLRAITVLFRPLPPEATSPQELMTSIESFGYAIALGMSLKKIFKSTRRDYPYGVYAFVAVVLFVIVFGSFANFGILARQRTQILPFLFILLCMPGRPKPVVYKSLMQRKFELEPTPER